MSRIQLHSRETGGYELLVDGKDISSAVTELTLHINGHDAVLELVIPTGLLDVDVAHVDVVEVDAP